MSGIFRMMSILEEADLIYYDPRTDGEQLNIPGDEVVITDDAILLGSNASDGARLISNGVPLLDIEIFTDRSHGWLEVYPLDGRDKPATVMLPYPDLSDVTLRSAVTAVMVARAQGKIDS